MLSEALQLLVSPEFTKGDQMTSPQQTRILLMQAIAAVGKITHVLGDKLANEIRDQIQSAGEDYFEEGGGD